MDQELKTRIEEMVNGDAVFLFMKGSPSFPQCGFSGQVVQILNGYNIKYDHFNVLSDEAVRQGVKTFSDWPTIPQLYVKGEFIGGCDIVRESWESGELTELLQAAFPDQKIVAPRPPVKPKNISPAQAKDLLGQEGVKCLDVRSPEEQAVAAVGGFDLLTQELAEEILEKWDKQTPLVFMCHFGGRSAQAAAFFANHGFRDIYNVEGGIDAWSETVDTTVPRY